MKLLLLLILPAVFFVVLSPYAPNAAEVESLSGQMLQETSRKPAGLAAGRKTYVKGEVIIRFADSADERAMAKVISSIDGEIIRVLSAKRKTYLVRLPTHLDAQDAIETLNETKEVIYAVLNRAYNLNGERP